MTSASEPALVDTNVLVYALFPAVPDFAASRALLDTAKSAAANPGGADDEPGVDAVVLQCVEPITESGGPLSHGAVTAREMRLPAVMSVRGAMALFEDGQTVTVDGTQGLVHLA
jgi:hypothetical protein